jgi:hypothetical protein
MNSNKLSRGPLTPTLSPLRGARATARLSIALGLALGVLGLASTVRAEVPVAATGTSVSSNTAPSAKAPYHLGAHFEVDAGLMIALKQAAGFSGGVVYGPFRAGLSYATFQSNGKFGGVPDGFNMRVNYLIGINASYFIGRRTDEGFYVQGMFHIKQQGVDNKETGDHVDLSSLAAGLELGYVLKVYKGLYVAPRIGALYYVKKPQPNNEPVMVGDRTYDNARHKDWDTYFIPTLSVGYSW